MNIPFLTLHKSRTTLKETLKYATAVYRMQCDIVPDDTASELKQLLDDSKQLLASTKDPERLIEASRHVSEAVSPKDTPWRSLHTNVLAENFEVLIVAIAVAMAFRCYFFQPFKIPTGSMQPTLYGIHSTPSQTSGFFDKKPLNILKWLVTGDLYKEVRVSHGGRLYFVQRTIKPGYLTFKVSGRQYHVPSDAIGQDVTGALTGLRNIGRDNYVKGNSVIWSGIIHSGDHVFVNRIAWNFRRPKRGEVMVFSTTGINGLPSNTHYIKRTTGTPNDTVSIRPPELIVNGESVTAPETIARIVRKDRISPSAPAYTGYKVIGNGQCPPGSKHPLRTASDSITLGPDQYLGMGDNTSNSYDSRYWGPVPEKNLLGPGALVYWPFTSPRFGIIK